MKHALEFIMSLIYEQDKNQQVVGRSNSPVRPNDVYVILIPIHQDYTHTPSELFRRTFCRLFGEVECANGKQNINLK